MSEIDKRRKLNEKIETGKLRKALKLGAKHCVERGTFNTKQEKLFEKSGKFNFKKVKIKLLLSLSN